MQWNVDWMIRSTSVSQRRNPNDTFQWHISMTYFYDVFNDIFQWRVRMTCILWRTHRLDIYYDFTLAFMLMSWWITMEMYTWFNLHHISLSRSRQSLHQRTRHRADSQIKSKPDSRIISYRPSLNKQWNLAAESLCLFMCFTSRARLLRALHS